MDWRKLKAIDEKIKHRRAKRNKEVLLNKQKIYTTN